MTKKALRKATSRALGMELTIYEPGSMLTRLAAGRDLEHLTSTWSNGK